MVIIQDLKCRNTEILTSIITIYQPCYKTFHLYIIYYVLYNYFSQTFKGGGGFSPGFCKNTILRYELAMNAMMARTCTNNLRVVLSHYVQQCLCEASEQKCGQKTNI